MFNFIGKLECIKLEEFIGFSYHLMLVYELLPCRGLDEVVAAILAATALAAYGRNYIAQGVEPNGVARQFLYLADEIILRSYIALLILATYHNGIGKHNDLATAETIAVHSVHYHSIAALQLGRKTAYGH